VHQEGLDLAPAIGAIPQKWNPSVVRKFLQQKRKNNTLGGMQQGQPVGYVCA